MFLPTFTFLQIYHIFLHCFKKSSFPFSLVLRFEKPALNYKLIFISSMSCLYVDLVSYVFVLVFLRIYTPKYMDIS